MDTSWHVAISFDAMLSEDAAMEIAGDLAEYGAVASVSRAFDSGTVDLVLDAPDALGASEQSARVVLDALVRHGAGSPSVTGIDVQTEEAFEEELRTPVFPEVVGYAEIAHMAGVSRQRARQFAAIAGFPQPAIVTAQGPLMTKASVTQWLRDRSTSRRPAKPVHV